MAGITLLALCVQAGLLLAVASADPAAVGQTIGSVRFPSLHPRCVTRRHIVSAASQPLSQCEEDSGNIASPSIIRGLSRRSCGNFRSKGLLKKQERVPARRYRLLHRGICRHAE